MKKFSIKSIVLVFSAVVVIFLLYQLLANSNQIRTILSLKKVDDHPLYSLTYYGDYKFDYIVKKTVSNQTSVNSETSETNEPTYMCSSFLVKNEKGEPIFCRNLDYTLLGHPIAILHTSTLNKNSSISMADLFYLGYNKNNLPSDSMFNRLGLLKTPRITIDGMNEYGVALAILSVPFAGTSNDPKKETIDEVAANRLVLDNAKNVDEAISIIKKYNIEFHEGPAHFMIADSSGKSAVVEFIDGKVVTVVKEKPWQVATNFILSKDIGEKTGLDRYEIADSFLKKSQDSILEDEAIELLSKISQGGTVWSIIYNLKTGDVKVAMDKKYSEIRHFKLDMK